MILAWVRAFNRPTVTLSHMVDRLVIYLRAFLQYHCCIVNMILCGSTTDYVYVDM